MVLKRPLRPVATRREEIMPLHLELMPLEEKPPEAPPPKTMVVRYGYLREIGEFVSDVTQKVGCGTKLIIRTDRGTEIAEMLTGMFLSRSLKRFATYFDLDSGTCRSMYCTPDQIKTVIRKET